MIEKLDSKFMEFDTNHVNTVCKYGNAELLEDEFKDFQVKI